MTIRDATDHDIPQMQVVRNAVTENRLSDPALVPDADYVAYLSARGRGWVCEVDGRVAGFAIADLQGHNIWALFLLPQYEGRGIGRLLHDTMLHWYFSRSRHTVWLSTAPGTRAEKFYRAAGWQEAGMYGRGELKFEMSADKWLSK